jgi:hypothetical protein
VDAKTLEKILKEGKYDTLFCKEHFKSVFEVGKWFVPTLGSAEREEVIQMRQSFAITSSFYGERINLPRDLV